ncbi:MAG TPA: hypothetical protein VFG51_03605 [Candidatus Saccharimonadia bacterium]|nr:hypothetical protein [Candidatus Saccharimonadia bacterium]
MNNSATSFIFLSHDFDRATGLAQFRYRVEFSTGKTEDYLETLRFPVEKHKVVLADTAALKPFLQSLHLLLGISFWKMYCPPEIRIEGYSLSQSQANFWNTFYTNGLGEFFYKNQIDFRGLVKFPFGLKAETEPVHLTHHDRSLVPFGGGKDSIVTAELMKARNKPFSAHTVGSHPIQEQVIKRMGVDHLIVERTLDPRMIELSLAKKVYTGHVPATAIYALTTLMSAALFGYSAVVLSNEKSSSYGNVQYLGREVNHQWSKSAEAENLLQEYVRNHITPDIAVFSLLRPLYEIEITRRFTEFPEFFPFFSSCNRNFSLVNPPKKGLWCGECPKCAFMFAMLAAQLPRDIVIEIFSKNLFADEKLLQLYRELLGLAEFKPFECVGTPEEMKVAMHLIVERHEFDHDAIMKMFSTEVMPTLGDVSNLESNVFSVHEDHMIPEEFQ